MASLMPNNIYILFKVLVVSPLVFRKLLFAVSHKKARIGIRVNILIFYFRLAVL
jgi:hypothetical protein